MWLQHNLPCRNFPLAGVGSGVGLRQPDMTQRDFQRCSLKWRLPKPHRDLPVSELVNNASRQNLLGTALELSSHLSHIISKLHWSGHVILMRRLLEEIHLPDVNSQTEAQMHRCANAQAVRQADRQTVDQTHMGADARKNEALLKQLSTHTYIKIDRGGCMMSHCHRRNSAFWHFWGVFRVRHCFLCI